MIDCGLKGDVTEFEFSIMRKASHHRCFVVILKVQLRQDAK